MEQSGWTVALRVDSIFHRIFVRPRLGLLNKIPETGSPPSFVTGTFSFPAPLSLRPSLMAEKDRRGLL